MSTIDLPYFFARPIDANGAGVVVLHEGNGLSPQLMRLCQRLAAAGFTTVAPDLYFRAGGSEAGPFAALMGSLRSDQVNADLAQSVSILHTAGARKVGVTGFCLGGSLTYRAATQTSQFDAAIGYYGSFIADELSVAGCPLQLFFAGADAYIPAESIERIVAHHPSTLVYPGVDHGFMRDGSPTFDEAAASDVWGRSLHFFRQHLLE